MQNTSRVNGCLCCNATQGRVTQTLIRHNDVELNNSGARFVVDMLQ